MSRVGQAPISVPDKVKVSVSPDNRVGVKGPLGELETQVAPEISVTVADGVVTFERPDDTRHSRAKHGLYRSLVANMVSGVTEGFERRLEIEGVGYRADKEGKSLKLRVGLSHEVVIEPLPGIEIDTDGNQIVIVKGCDKQAVGQMAARIRAVRPVEPYKGKGIRYEGERVRRKAGKSAKVGTEQ
jgi:large subunit ribosomal protein L6